MNKKGQEGGGGAAALVALIALFMVLYILFLPPEERSKLLGENPVDGEKELETHQPEILLTHPGRVLPKGDVMAFHPLPPVLLTTKIEAKEIESWNTLSIRRSVLSSVPQELRFTISDPENIDNLLLTFLVAEGKGILSITLNGEQIFSEEVTTRNIEPIKLKRSSVRKENLLLFSVSSPSPAFWRSHYYTLSGITLHGDLTDRTKQKAQSTFYIDNEEKTLLKRGALSFTALCDPSSNGKVTLRLNDHSLFEGVPSCNIATRMDVPIDLLISGTNTLTWQSEEGRYKFDIVRFETALKEPQNYRAYFSVTPEQYHFAKDHAYPFLLSLTFVGDEKREARVFVNDFVLTLDTGAQEYKTEISDFVRKGYNSIEIDPTVPFDVQELKVEILEKP